MADSGPLTQSQAFALLKRTSDEGWIAAELSGPDGTAVLNARTAIAAATSQALQDQASRCTISDAPGGTPGGCTLTVSRNLGAGTISFPKGYPFATDEGIALVLAQPILIPSGPSPQTFDLPLQPLRQTELVNTYDPAFDSLLNVGDLMATAPAAPLILDSASNAVLGPGATDDGHALRYSSSTAITQAAADWLSAHGDERSQRRAPGEATEEYRARIRLFPDAVSPIAVATAIHGLAQNGGLMNVTILEPFNPLASPALLTQYSLGFFDSEFGDDAFCDDVVEDTGIREARAYFRISVNGELHEPDGSVLYCDDDGFCDDEVWGYPDIALHPQLQTALLGLGEEARVKKAGGVQFDTYIENSTRLDGVGEVVADPGGTAAFALTPVAGKAWMLREGVVSVTGPLDPATDAFMVVLALADAGSIATPWVSPTDCLPLRKQDLVNLGYHHDQVIGIAVLVKSSVSATLRAVGTFWVTEMTL